VGNTAYVRQPPNSPFRPSLARSPIARGGQPADLSDVVNASPARSPEPPECQLRQGGRSSPLLLRVTPASTFTPMQPFSGRRVAAQHDANYRICRSCAPGARRPAWLAPQADVARAPVEPWRARDRRPPTPPALQGVPSVGLLPLPVDGLACLDGVAAGWQERARDEFQAAACRPRMKPSEKHYRHHGPLHQCLHPGADHSLRDAWVLRWLLSCFLFLQNCRRPPWVPLASPFPVALVPHTSPPAS